MKYPTLNFSSLKFKMLCLKNFKMSNAIKAAERVIHDQKPHIAILTSHKLTLHTLTMKPVMEIPFHGVLTHIIPMDNKFVCLGPEFILEVGLTIRKSKNIRRINPNKIFDAKAFTLIFDKRIILLHKLKERVVLDDSVNNLVYLDIVDISIDGNLIYVLYKELCGRKSERDLSFSQQIGIFKYQCNETMYVESINLEDNAYKIIVWNKQIVLIDTKSISLVKKESPVKRDEANKQQVTRQEILHELNNQKIVDYWCDMNYIVMICSNGEILTMNENYKVSNLGFLPFTTSKIINICDGVFLAIGPECHSLIKFPSFEEKENKKRRLCEEPGDFFINRNIELLKEQNTIEYTGKVFFDGSHLLITKNDSDNTVMSFINAYKLKEYNVVSFQENVRNLCVFGDTLFVSFLKSHIIYDLNTNKQLLESVDPIQSFCLKKESSGYLMNTSKTLKNNDHLYTLDFQVILISFYQNKILFYCKKTDGFYLLLCEDEAVISEERTGCDISLILLDKDIYISRFDDTFTILDYNLNIKRTIKIESFRYAFKIPLEPELYAFCTENGVFYKYEGSFVKFFELKQRVKQIVPYTQTKIAVLGDRNYVFDFNSGIDFICMQEIHGKCEYINIHENSIYYAYLKDIYQSPVSENPRLIEERTINKKCVVHLMHRSKFNERIKFMESTKPIVDNNYTSITTTMCLYRNDILVDKYKFRGFIFKQAKIFNCNVLIVSLNNEKKTKSSVIQFYAIYKKLKWLCELKGQSDVLSMDALDNLIVIGFISKIVIYKLVDDKLILVAENHSIQLPRDIFIDKVESNYNMIIQDPIKKFLIYKYTSENMTVDFVEGYDFNFKALKKLKDTQWVGLTEDNSFQVLEYNNNVFKRLCVVYEDVYDFQAGTLDVFSVPNLYFTTNEGCIKYFVDISRVMNKEDIKTLLMVQKRLFCIDNILFSLHDYIHFDLIKAETNESILNELDIEVASFREILSRIEVLK